MSSPSTSRRAVIDVGTNSVKVLVGDVAPDGSVEPVLETSEQTRMGRGFYETHRLQPEPIAATAAAVGRFVRIAKEHGATIVRVVATSAARDAQNRDELLAALLAAPGRVFSRDQLMNAAWDDPGAALDRTVDAHVKLLRAKLREAAPEADPIVTHRGLGYSLREE